MFARALRWPAGVLAVFSVAQILAVTRGARGSLVDEGIYWTIGARLLHGFGNELKYQEWVNGNPYFYPPLSGLGFALGGVAGGRLVSVVFAVATLAVFWLFCARAFGRASAQWSLPLLAGNALFFALAHTAVYDGPALLALAVALVLATQKKSAAAAVACAVAYSAKYALAMLSPFVLLILLWSLHDWRQPGWQWRQKLRPVATFSALLVGLVVAHDLVLLQRIFPGSFQSFAASSAGFDRSTLAGYIAYLAVIPFAFVAFGAALHAIDEPNPRARRRLLAFDLIALCCLFFFPALHLVIGVKTNLCKHVMLGALPAFAVAGDGLRRAWQTRGRLLVPSLLVLTAAHGLSQGKTQDDKAWYDFRPAIARLKALRQGKERVLTDFRFQLLPDFSAQPPYLPLDTVVDEYSLNFDSADPCSFDWALGLSRPDWAWCDNFACKMARRCGFIFVESWPVSNYYPAGWTERIDWQYVGLYRHP